MLSNGQVVALDARGVDDLAHGRGLQKGLQLLLGAVRQARRDTDQMLPVTFFDDYRVTQVRRRPLPRKWKASARALPMRGVVFTVHLQEGLGVVRQIIAGKERQVRIRLSFETVARLPAYSWASSPGVQ